MHPFAEGEINETERNRVEVSDHNDWIRTLVYLFSYFSGLLITDRQSLFSKCAPELIKGTPKQVQEHYWRFFRDVAQAVKDSGVPGTLIIPCNYGYWRGDPPDFDIPDNAVLHFFMHGPWKRKYVKAISLEDKS